MELPNVYASPINKEINNVQKIYKGELTDRTSENKVPLKAKINNIFASKNFVYKCRVRVTTIKGKEEKVIVGRTDNALLTLSGERIKINDIYDVEIV